MPTLEQVNQVLAHVIPDARLEINKLKRLVLRQGDKKASIRVCTRTGTRLSNPIHNIKMTPIQEKALVQLIHWLRDKPHRGIQFWMDFFPIGLVRLIKQLGYESGTECLICKGPAKEGCWVIQPRWSGPACKKCVTIHNLPTA